MRLQNPIYVHISKFIRFLIKFPVELPWNFEKKKKKNLLVTCAMHMKVLYNMNFIFIQNMNYEIMIVINLRLL